MAAEAAVDPWSPPDIRMQGVMSFDAGRWHIDGLWSFAGSPDDLFKFRYESRARTDNAERPPDGAYDGVLHSAPLPDTATPLEDHMPQLKFKPRPGGGFDVHGDALNQNGAATIAGVLSDSGVVELDRTWDAVYMAWLRPAAAASADGAKLQPAALRRGDDEQPSEPLVVGSPPVEPRSPVRMGLSSSLVGVAPTETDASATPAPSENGEEAPATPSPEDAAEAPDACHPPSSDVQNDSAVEPDELDSAAPIADGLASAPSPSLAAVEEETVLGPAASIFCGDLPDDTVTEPDEEAVEACDEGRLQDPGCPEEMVMEPDEVPDALPLEAPNKGPPGDPVYPEDTVTESDEVVNAVFGEGPHEGRPGDLGYEEETVTEPDDVLNAVSGEDLNKGRPGDPKYPEKTFTEQDDVLNAVPSEAPNEGRPGDPEYREETVTEPGEIFVAVSREAPSKARPGDPAYPEETVTKPDKVLDAVDGGAPSTGRPGDSGRTEEAVSEPDEVLDAAPGEAHDEDFDEAAAEALCEASYEAPDEAPDKAPSLKSEALANCASLDCADYADPLLPAVPAVCPGPITGMSLELDPSMSDERDASDTDGRNCRIEAGDEGGNVDGAGNGKRPRDEHVPVSPILADEDGGLARAPKRSRRTPRVRDARHPGVWREAAERGRERRRATSVVGRVFRYARGPSSCAIS